MNEVLVISFRCCHLHFYNKNCFIVLGSLCVVEFLTCVPIKCVDSQLSNVGGSEGSWCDINWINS